MRFEYCDAKTIGEAVSLLGEGGGEARLLAGGTDVLVMLKEEKIRLKCLIDIKPIKELAGISWDEQKGLKIGALTTIRSLERSFLVLQKAPVISESACQLGSVQIRNRATIGGNLCQAVPSAEMPPSLIALGAGARIYGSAGYRTIPLEELFNCPRETCLAPQEIMVELEVPPMQGGAGASYLRFSPRKAMDLAVVGVATMVKVEDGVFGDCRIALGAVAPIPMRAVRAEEFLRGQRVEAGAIERAAELAAGEAKPISDIRASAEYRRELVKVLTRRALGQSLERARAGRA